MAIYYFDLKDGTRLRDHSGIDFDTDAEAVAHAKKVAVDVAAERKIDANAPPLFVSIIDHSGREVERVPVRLVSKS